MEEVLIVDLDRNQNLMLAPQYIQILPNEIDTVKQVLEEARGPFGMLANSNEHSFSCESKDTCSVCRLKSVISFVVVNDKQLDSLIIQAFFNFHFAIVGQYRWYIKQDADDKTVFDGDLFIRNQRDPELRNVWILAKLHHCHSAAVSLCVELFEEQ